MKYILKIYEESKYYLLWMIKFECSNQGEKTPHAQLISFQPSHLYIIIYGAWFKAMGEQYYPPGQLLATILCVNSDSLQGKMLAKPYLSSSSPVASNPSNIPSPSTMPSLPSPSPLPPSSLPSPYPVAPPNSSLTTSSNAKNANTCASNLARASLSSLWA